MSIKYFGQRSEQALSVTQEDTACKLSLLSFKDDPNDVSMILVKYSQGLPEISLHASTTAFIRFKCDDGSGGVVLYNESRKYTGSPCITSVEIIQGQTKSSLIEYLEFPDWQSDPLKLGLRDDIEIVTCTIGRNTSQLSDTMNPKILTSESNPIGEKRSRIPRALPPSKLSKTVGSANYELPGTVSRSDNHQFYTFTDESLSNIPKVRDRLNGKTTITERRVQRVSFLKNSFKRGDCIVNVKTMTLFVFHYAYPRAMRIVVIDPANDSHLGISAEEFVPCNADQRQQLSVILENASIKPLKIGCQAKILNDEAEYIVKTRHSYGSYTLMNLQNKAIVWAADRESIIPWTSIPNPDLPFAPSPTATITTNTNTNTTPTGI